MEYFPKISQNYYYHEEYIQFSLAMKSSIDRFLNILLNSEVGHEQSQTFQFICRIIIIYYVESVFSSYIEYVHCRILQNLPKRHHGLS